MTLLFMLSKHTCSAQGYGGWLGVCMVSISEGCGSGVMGSGSYSLRSRCFSLTSWFNGAIWAEKISWQTSPFHKTSRQIALHTLPSSSRERTECYYIPLPPLSNTSATHSAHEASDKDLCSSDLNSKNSFCVWCLLRIRVLPVKRIALATALPQHTFKYCSS